MGREFFMNKFYSTLAATIIGLVSTAHAQTAQIQQWIKNKECKVVEIRHTWGKSGIANFATGKFPEWDNFSADCDDMILLSKSGESLATEYTDILTAKTRSQLLNTTPVDLLNQFRDALKNLGFTETNEVIDNNSYKISGKMLEANPIHDSKIIETYSAKDE